MSVFRTFAAASALVLAGPACGAQAPSGQPAKPEADPEPEETSDAE